MDNFIKKISEGHVDDHVHQKFIRYGPGKFEKEAFIIKVMASSVQIQSGIEYGDVIYGLLARELDQDVSVSGVIVSKKDIKPELSELGVESVQKGKKYSIKMNFKPAEFKVFIDKMKDYYLLLNVKSSAFSVSSKKSVPKPGKPVEKFYSLKMPVDRLDEIKAEFLFDVDAGKFKTATINHTYIIDEVAIPKEYGDDPSMARLKAVRKGNIHRQTDVDGKITKTDYKLFA